MRSLLSTRRQGGFTLIELLVVVLIIGILLAVSAPAFLSQTQKAQDSAAKQMLAVAYKDAKAESVLNTPQGDWGSAAALVSAIQADEPELNISLAAPVTAAKDIEVQISSGTLTLTDKSASSATCTLTAVVNQAIQGPSCSTSSSSTSSSYSQTILASNPVAYWRLNDTTATAADASGHGNSGSYPQAPTLAAGPTGDQAAYFDGTNAVSVTPASPATLSGTYTVEMWAKPDDATTRALFGSRAVGADQTFDLQLVGGGAAHSDIGTGTAWLTTNADGAYSYSPGQWLYLAEVVTPTGYALYVNGNELASGSWASSTPLVWGPSNPLRIGWDNFASDSHYKGYLSDVAVYSSALSTATIQSHYTASGRSVPAASSYMSAVLSSTPVAFWRLNETTGTMAIDAADHHNYGTYHTTAIGTAAGNTTDGDRAGAFDGASWVDAAPTSVASVVAPYTVEAWVRPSTTATAEVVLGSRSSGDFSFDTYFAGGNTIHVDIGNGTAWLSTSSVSFTYSANQWYHLAVAVGSGSWTVYVNGTSVGGGTYSAGTPVLWDSSHHILIGETGHTGDPLFSGTIDDVAVYSASLLPATIQAHYNAR